MRAKERTKVQRYKGTKGKGEIGETLKSRQKHHFLLLLSKGFLLLSNKSLLLSNRNTCLQGV